MTKTMKMTGSKLRWLGAIIALSALAVGVITHCHPESVRWITALCGFGGLGLISASPTLDDD